ncbi:DUF742 domain-containing protein [Streptomyces sp. TRM68367]|uniref:DUF742 domain-containing protein n=1 Tax=Streptomyces sp. TRM68367 TaxID=2758415 RepID=UPI00165B5243|nr:DUF742 domain-containing protein [Streptomyces sp. TRM68367]MBC9724974.1 DUF742 domain-containing protein [Streptomyces sp. TRM68367]
MSRPGQYTPSSTAPSPAFVRPYLVTRGRTQARHWLSPETVLEAGDGRAGPQLMEGEYQQIVLLCRQRRRSVAELAGTIRLPLSATRVLISDLVDARVLVLPVTNAYTPPDSPDSPTGNRPTRQLMEALRAGLERMPA